MVKFGGDLRAKVDNLYNIGSSSRPFSDIYLLQKPNGGSDIRMKKDIENMPYGLDEVMKLRPVRYRLKNGGNDDKHLGLIAQEVEKVVPDVVGHDDRHHEAPARASRRIRETVRAGAHCGVPALSQV